MLENIFTFLIIFSINLYSLASTDNSKDGVSKIVEGAPQKLKFLKGKNLKVFLRIILLDLLIKGEIKNYSFKENHMKYL